MVQQQCTATDIGGVRSLQIMSSGQGYASIPPVSVANTEISSYGNAPEKVGANSIFVNLANTIANTFTANTLIKNSTNNAFGSSSLIFLILLQQL